MKQPTYSEQWQKITSAYLNDELEPFDNCACFIGNLMNGDSDWSCLREPMNCIGDGILEDNNLSIYRSGLKVLEDESNNLYSPEDILTLENNFLKILYEKARSDTRHPNYENALFEAMVSTLEMLKQIHISKGEDVDEGLVLTQRQKQTL